MGTTVPPAFGKVDALEATISLAQAQGTAGAPQNDGDALPIEADLALAQAEGATVPPDHQGNADSLTATITLAEATGTTVAPAFGIAQPLEAVIWPWPKSTARPRRRGMRRMLNPLEAALRLTQAAGQTVPPECIPLMP